MVHVPQTNNGMFSIGRDVNIRFRNSAIEAVDPENKISLNGGGRISVTVWGQAENALEELGSPPRLQNPLAGKS
jgi:ssDNA-binding replication factor A large subunit